MGFAKGREGPGSGRETGHRGTALGESSLLLERVEDCRG